MRDFSHLPAPILLEPLPGHFQMITEGDSSNYFCPDCGKHLCWINAIDEWTCLNCEDTTTKMEIKTISYQRVLNLGNYNTKRLEMTAQLNSDEDFDAATSALMQTVEVKIREDKEFEIVSHIESLQTRANNLKQEISYLEEKLAKLKHDQDLAQLKPETEPDPDDIPFGGEGRTSNNLDDF
ncbi:hypothetical protein [Nostoc sp. 2RC]|jgi:DNA-directed RNA polymerase subunit M/transcription elongation factor TFIIS|uniref:hypothetical protein n=1 Tax=Nostoc sp. 2RC TaxID=2485484 RepID=UPI00162908E0|nr:hypothetical protein [Nostoc sp. 2RC]MBC1241861.1 hypothetical protein [Nostoc sp. 2RC]